MGCKKDMFGAKKVLQKKDTKVNYKEEMEGMDLD